MPREMQRKVTASCRCTSDLQLCERWGRVLGGRRAGRGQQDDRAGQDRAGVASERLGETNLGRFWLSNPAVDERPVRDMYMRLA